MKVRLGIVAVALAALLAGGWCAGCSSPAPVGEPIRGARVIGGLGDTPGRLAYPRAIRASKDSIWVIDRSARVQRLDPANGECLAWFRMPEWDLGKPVGFAIAPGPTGTEGWDDELLYIADTHYHRVMVVRLPEAHRPGKESQPEIVRQVGEYGTGPGQFIYPTSVAVLMSEDGKSIRRIYVGEYGGNDRVSVFDADWTFQFSFGTLGPGLDPKAIEFSRPQSLELVRVGGMGGATELLIADALNHRLGRFTLDGALIGWISEAGKPGTELGRFKYPYGLASLGDGTVLVSEFGGQRVQRIDVGTGKGLGAWGNGGRGDGQLAGAWAVAVFGSHAFVVDASNNRILAFGREW